MPTSHLRTLLPVLCAGAFSFTAFADEAASTATTEEAKNAAEVDTKEDGPPPLPALSDKLQAMVDGGFPLNPEKTVVLDKKKNRLLLRTQVVCEDCLLEMLCCTEQTKEHEALLSFRGSAAVVHTGLLALGAKAGKPASFSPEFAPPTGQRINIFVNWTDEAGKLHREDARTWMRTSVSRYYSQPLPKSPPGVKLPLMELRYDPYNKEILWYGQMSDEQRKKLLALWDDKTYQAAIAKFYKESQPRPMDNKFVFAGSYHFSRVDGGPKIYAAEEGYLVCVANFAGSLIDVQEASSASDGGQSFEGWKGRVPPRGTAVILELVPDAATDKLRVSENASTKAASPDE